ncbi:EboA domain-containing protein [Dyadobacter subterraneus]|uniref:EboA domain-containing protein n=1 Tax=Dyadobacter subterraneus TaxID=2773304 RepID=A0ABR9W4U8_9BACT|nr:EboA domain-containing protein [Dyadobacter subterraneus]MBE9460465.1 EboA domain-containing protein [Dyadobacter subterraneus]
MSHLIDKTLWEIISQNTSDTESEWLTEKGKASPIELMTAFVASPRFLSKKIVNVEIEEEKALTDAVAGFSVNGWSLVRLSRVWLLTQLDETEKETFIKNIETLFDTAEMNELVALYSALPVLAYPEQWLFRATDAVRSNMGFVFDAIALHNPFPAKYFSELAWNQLVLKTIFNDKPVHFITGLEERENANLALILSDFAHERWAAGRSVAPNVWRLVSKFMNEQLLSDMKHLFESRQTQNQEAAALACYDSDYAPAKALLSSYPEFEKSIDEGALTWSNLEFTDLNTYVPTLQR